MTFYKIVENNNIISVGCVFLKWNIKRHKFNICDVDEGQFVQTYDEKAIYRADWMKPAPNEASGFNVAKVIIINQTEYEDLKAMLDEGESIQEEVVEPVLVQHVEVHEPEKEKPMSIAQIRELLVKQQEQIELLMQKLK